MIPAGLPSDKFLGPGSLWQRGDWFRVQRPSCYREQRSANGLSLLPFRLDREVFGLLGRDYRDSILSEARVAELADAQDLGSCGETRGGSNPPSRNCSPCVTGFQPVDHHQKRVLDPVARRVALNNCGGAEDHRHA